MTRASVREYAARQRARYQQANRSEKHRLLDEMVAVTGMHRKAVIRLLRRAPRSGPAPGRAGRPRLYGAPVAAAVEVLWQASGRIGAHRLHPFVPELLDRLLRYDELRLTPALDKLVRQVSRPTPSRACSRRPVLSTSAGAPPRPSPTRSQRVPGTATSASGTSIRAGSLPRRYANRWSSVRRRA